MSYTIKEERAKVQQHQKLITEFSSIVKTMDSIVFMAYGDDFLSQNEIEIYAGNLSLLHYFLWKSFEAANSQKFSFKDYDALRMFLVPAMQGSLQYNGEHEYAYIHNNPFESLKKSTFTTSKDFLTALYGQLDTIKRNNATEPLKLVRLNGQLPDDDDLRFFLDTLDIGFKGQPEKLLIVLIITSYLCGAIKNHSGIFSYEYCITLLFRVVLLLDGESFLDDANYVFVNYLHPINDSIQIYKALNRNLKIEQKVNFLYGVKVKENNISLLSFERELFRITQRLYRIAIDDENAHNKNPKQQILIKILKKLFNITEKVKNLPFTEKVEFSKLRNDEENFYYLLDLASINR